MAARIPGRWLVYGIVGLAVAIATTVVVYRKVYHLRRFAVIADGVLYRSAQMSTDSTLRRLLERTAARTVICLRSTAEHTQGDWLESEQRIAAEMGATVRLLPLEYDTPPTDEQIAEFLSVMDEPAAWPVIIHCEVGAIRTGLVAAVFRIERHGWTPAEALAEYYKIGGDHTTKPKRAALAEWIANYKPRFPRPAMPMALAPATIGGG